MEHQEDDSKLSIMTKDDIVAGDSSTTDARPFSRQQYKLTVEYNGYRFNGFQKQASQAKSTSNNKQPPKRPHWDVATGLMKRVPTTIQECLQHALVKYIEYQVRQSRNAPETTTTLPVPSDDDDHSEGPPNQATKKRRVDKNNDKESFTYSLTELDFQFAGRTDKGVHALGQVVTCHFPILRPPLGWSHPEMLQGINSRLPQDISVARLEGPLSPHLNPRQEVVQKQYSYTIRYRRSRPGSDQTGGGVHTLRRALLDSPCLWIVPWPLNDQNIHKLCQALSGTHDYTRFTHKLARDLYPDHVLTVQLSFHIQQEDSDEAVTAQFMAQSKGFRRAMVRNLVGFCVQSMRVAATVATAGKDSTKNPVPISDASSDTVASTALWDHNVAPHLDRIEAAPASGLCLDWIAYSQDEFMEYQKTNGVSTGERR